MSEFGAQVYHNGEITSYEAAAINGAITIIAYGGTHGHILDRLRPLKAVDIEYAAAAGVVDSLDPERGDTLFVENPGCVNSPYNQLLFAWGSHEERMEILEKLRQTRSVSAFEYASLRARLRGIPVVSADVHMDVVRDFTAVTGFVPWGPPQPEASPYAEVFEAFREEQAANTVKDHARAMLPDLNGRRPTYPVLWGKGHYAEERQSIPGVLNTPGIIAAFGNLSLQVQYQSLPDALRERYLYRIKEMLSHLPYMPNAPERLHEEAWAARYVPSRGIRMP